jgi:hypothetical protein
MGTLDKTIDDKEALKPTQRLLFMSPNLFELDA